MGEIISGGGVRRYSSEVFIPKMVLNFMNYNTAWLLNNVLIRFTKSRPRQSNDNGLVDTKNGSVVRKQLGSDYIPQRCAELINESD